MELKELEYIVTIAEEGGISKAAQKLYLAQSSLSQFLARYEAELDTKLFVRTGSGVRPTIEGEIFIRNARQMLQQYRRVKEELREAELPKGGQLIFGISSFRGAALIPPVLQRFRAEYPTVNVIISEHDSIVLQKKVAAGELDMALVAFPANQCPRKNSTVLQDEVCLVANRAHPVMEFAHYGQRSRPWIDLRDTANFEYLLSKRSNVLGTVAQQQFKEYGINPPVINENLTAAFAQSMAAHGLGLAFTYGSCAVPSADVEYFSLGKERYFVDLALMFPPDGYRSRSNRALEEMIREFFNNEDNNGET